MPLKDPLKDPLKMVHAGGMGHAKENSVKAVKISMKNGADIIELDLRKSSDGVLFCYHGFGVIVYLLAYFLRFMPFKLVRKITKANTIDEILNIIDKPTIIALDLKSIDITAEDIKNIKFAKHHEVWISFFLFSHLKKIKEDLHGDYKFINYLSLWAFDSNVEKARKAGLHAFQIFPWQCTETNIKKIQDAGMKHAIAPVLVRKSKFYKLIDQFGSYWICFNELGKKKELVSIQDYL